jgi:hypothetical protein
LRPKVESFVCKMAIVPILSADHCSKLRLSVPEVPFVISSSKTVFNLKFYY